MEKSLENIKRSDYVNIHSQALNSPKIDTPKHIKVNILEFKRGM